MKRLAALLVIAIMMFVGGIVSVGPSDSALAQARPPPGATVAPPPPRRGFFDFLFGSRNNPPSPPAAPRRSTAGTPIPVPTVEAEPKDPNATKVLVVGDFVASGLASGLEQTFAIEPKLVAIDRTSANSGIVRDDYYDWGARLPEILIETAPDIVVVAIGSNDRQPISVDGASLQPRSEGWEKAYAERTGALIGALRAYRRPFFWVSAPPMPSTSASRDMAYLNDLFKPRVTAAGGIFVDIWNGFTDADGRFITSGPDVDGQLRALRSNDGINFTRAGRLKIAFYVDREMRHQTGIGTGAVNLLASAGRPGHVEIGPDGQQRLVGPIIALSDPPPGAPVVLAGAVLQFDVGNDLVARSEVVTLPPPDRTTVRPFDLGFPEVQPAPAAEPGSEPLLATPSDVESPQYLMIVKGVDLPVVPGRADDYAWPPRRVPMVMTLAEPELAGSLPLAANAGANRTVQAPAAAN